MLAKIPTIPSPRGSCMATITIGTLSRPAATSSTSRASMPSTSPLYSTRYRLFIVAGEDPSFSQCFGIGGRKKRRARREKEGEGIGVGSRRGCRRQLWWRTSRR
ncbi:hypothetical protein AAC387_Pa07g2470 [Persea americana]